MFHPNRRTDQSWHLHTRPDLRCTWPLVAAYNREGPTQGTPRPTVESDHTAGSCESLSRAIEHERIHAHRRERAPKCSVLLALLAAASAAFSATAAFGVTGDLRALGRAGNRAAARPWASDGLDVLVRLAGQHRLLVRGARLVAREEAGVVLLRDRKVAIDVGRLGLRVDDVARLGTAAALDRCVLPGLA